jgi:hypothetical protein
MMRDLKTRSAAGIEIVGHREARAVAVESVRPVRALVFSRVNFGSVAMALTITESFAASSHRELRPRIPTKILVAVEARQKGYDA